ncbi:MAG: oligosaccharide flippase family protein [Candidatus Cloacimonetes bacterium]|nr:oligosaccharide flippase family protein [Candidatus Cloacimonadota bacterium]
MSIKEFLKSLSVYGILPVFTKFASFLLVPIYVRVFSSQEFGIVELIVSSVNFIVFAMSLEFYGAVGRFFFEHKDLEGRRKLVSSGLIMTIAASLLVFTLGMLFQKHIGNILFKSQIYRLEIQIGLVWAVFMAVSTYLSVLPRYMKKAKLFVLYNAISLVVKLLSTIVYVVVLKLGVAGAVLGNLTGAITSTLLYGITSIVYIRPVFSYNHFKAIAKFSLPLVPGLLVYGFYQPAMRTILSRVYSMQSLGLFSFALKMVMIMTVVENSIKLSWKPMLYENLRNANFGEEYHKISKFVGKTLLSVGILITIATPELIQLIGTAEYTKSAQLVGPLIIGNVFANLTMLRGFGFEIEKKTYMLSLINILTSLIGLLFLNFIAPQLGFIGIGVAFLLPSFVAYQIQYFYTKKIIQSKSNLGDELWYWILLLLTSVFLVYEASIWLRIAVLSILVILIKPYSLLLSARGMLKRNKADGSA